MLPDLTVAAVDLYCCPMLSESLGRFEYRSPFPLERPGGDGCSQTGSAHVHLNEDVSGLFPYIYSIAKILRHVAKPAHVVFTVDDVLCTLYPHELIAVPFESEARAREFVGHLTKELDALADRRVTLEPRFELHHDVSALDVLRTLPRDRQNCGRCGHPTCMAFSVSVTKGDSSLDQCPETTPPLQEMSVYPIFSADGELADTLALPVRREPTEPPKFGLTLRELQVLRLLARGATNPEIAGELDISAHTVKTHVTHIFNKLSVDDRTQAAVMAVRLGLI